MAKKSISNAHFLVFLSRQCQNVENVHETFINTKIAFKRRNFLDHRVQKVPHVSSEISLRRLVQNKPTALNRRELNKDEFLAETQFHSEKLSFVHKKESEHCFNFFFPFVSFIGVFSNLKFKTLVLKTATWWDPLRCQIRLFPIPYVVDHLTFLGEGIWVI